MLSAMSLARVRDDVAGGDYVLALNKGLTRIDTDDSDSKTIKKD
jgi:hypothetical protein